MKMPIKTQNFFQGQDSFFHVEALVATPLLEECEDDTHTPEMGAWESPETPKTLEFDCRGQNTLP